MNRRTALRCLTAAAATACAGAAGLALAQAAPADAAAPAPEPTFTSRAGEILFRAMALLGTPYRRGGGSPETGFDCSGFVGYLFREVMGVRLPRSAWEIWRHGEEITHDALEPGDLVFYNTLRRPYSHVGVFIGDGKFIHAPASGGAVRTESMRERYWVRRWNGAKRLGT